MITLVVHPGYLGYAYTYTMCYASQARPWTLGHLWSLSVEEQFYLVWPAALVLGFAYRRQIGFAVLILAPLARLLFWISGKHEIDEYFPAVADSLMMGCLLAMYRDTLRRRVRWLTHPAVFGALALLTLFSQYLLPWVRLQIFFGGLVPFIIALFLFSAMERADGFLNNRVTSVLGVLSYSLYLWQQPFLNRNSQGWWAAFPLNLLLAIGCAVVSYYVVEKPFLGMYRVVHEKSSAALSVGL